MNVSVCIECSFIANVCEVFLMKCPFAAIKVNTPGPFCVFLILFQRCDSGFCVIVSVNSCRCGLWPDKSVKKGVCVTRKESITYSVQPWCMSMRRQRCFKHCQISVQMKWGGGGIRTSQKCCSQYCFIELISCCVERIHAVVRPVADSGSLFSLYMLPLSQIMRRNQIAYHSYADDTQIYLALSPNDYSHIDSLCQCIDEINSWMGQNFLQLNKEKTEVIAFGKKDEFLKVNAYLDSRGQTTKNQVRNLGVILETDLSFSSHVKAVSKSAYYHLKNIAKIRCFVSSQDLEKLVHAFITSRVDYCNGLLTGLPKKTIRQLQGFWIEPENLSTGFQLHLGLILKYFYSFINHSMA